VVRTVAIAGIATPSFWLGIVSLLAVLSISHALFGAPWMPPIDYVPFWQDPLHNLSVAILPALTVGYRYSAVPLHLHKLHCTLNVASSNTPRPVWNSAQDKHILSYGT
jgi:peptide/nickel transport system permease protein